MEPSATPLQESGEPRHGRTSNLRTEREGIRGLRATIDLAPIGMAQFDHDGRLLLANDRLCAMLGYRRDELLACTFHQLTFPEDLARCLELNASLAAGAIPSYRQDKRLLRHDGAGIWARVTVSAVRNPGGDVAFFVGIVEDVSGQEASERARRDAQERLHAALAASATGTFRWDIRTNELDWDENLDRLFGLQPGLTPRHMEQFFSLIHPDDQQRVVEACWLCAGDGVDFDEEFRVLHPDGGERWLSDRGKTFLDADGTPLYMTGACTDVTDRRRMEDELRQSEEHLRTSEAKLRRIVDSGMVGVFYWNLAGAITEANDEFLRMLGYSRADLSSGALDWRSLTTGASRETIATKKAELSATGAATPWEKSFLARDGRVVQVLIAAAMLEGSDDQGLAVCLDVSARKEAEVERERLLGRERRARAAAEQAIRLRDEVLAVVAHDLRNPVHTIAMGAAGIREFALTDEQRLRHLEIIERSARWMDRLISDLLDVTRIASENFPVLRNRMLVRTLLDETIELFESQARALNIELVCEVQPDVPPVMGDRDRLTQALSNLIANALKFTPPQGRIAIRARRAGGEIEFSVEDSGPGIAAANLPHVFDRFWQGDRKAVSGVGLGLAIVKGIVEAHDGRIRVESVVGRGTAFSFTLPCAD